jgi:hypothetical protein
MSILLHEIGADWKHEEVYLWDCVEAGEHYHTRLFYKPDEVIGHGFRFYAVRWCQSAGGLTEEQCWIDARTEVDVLVRGEAKFDGLRHIYFSPESEGYIYYASSRDLSQVFAELRTLEERFCKEIPA